MFYDVLCDHDQKLPTKDFCPSVTSHSYLGTYVLTPYVCSDTSSRHWLTSTMFWHLVTSLTSTTLIVAWRRARRCSICIAPLYFILTTEFSQQTKRQNDKTIQCSYRSTVQICTYCSTAVLHSHRQNQSSFRHQSSGEDSNPTKCLFIC